MPHWLITAVLAAALLVAPSPAADAAPDRAAPLVASNAAKKKSRGNKAPRRGAKPRKAAPPSKPPLGTVERLKVSAGPKKGKAASFNHAPYEMGECGLCHANANASNPGKLNAAVNDLCGECHDDIMDASYKHKAAVIACTNCHNPHNAERAKLLHEQAPGLCLKCHLEINDLVTNAKVQHQALSEGKSCLNCHDPHATSVEHLLVQIPMDLCLGCHSRDDMVDESGKKLTNLKSLLESNPVQHAPVEAGDCSACHRPHGSGHFRLLDSRYPEKFYAPWKSENYAICFQCHEESAFEEERTTTMTQFRDGAKNLHFVHVNKETRGRTCRACHEVHAAKQAGNIRDGVPYGKRGWMLTLNYTRTETGGYCQKTCHEKRSYKNAAVVPPRKASKQRLLRSGPRGAVKQTRARASKGNGG